MQIRTVVTIWAILLTAAWCTPASAQWKGLSLSAHSSFATPEIYVDSLATQPLYAPTLSAEWSRERNPMLIPVAGAAIGGLAMAALLAYGCRNTDCIFDPTIPIGVGVGAGLLVGLLIEAAVGSGERTRTTKAGAS